MLIYFKNEFEYIQSNLTKNILLNFMKFFYEKIQIDPNSKEIN